MKQYSLSLLALSIVLITYANGIVSTKFLNDKNIQLQSLTDENKDYKKSWMNMKQRECT